MSRKRGRGGRGKLVVKIVRKRGKKGQGFPHKAVIGCFIAGETTIKKDLS